MSDWDSAPASASTTLDLILYWHFYTTRRTKPTNQTAIMAIGTTISPANMQSKVASPIKK